MRVSTHPLCYYLKILHTFILWQRYTFVRRKTVERNRERLMKKVYVLLGQIDEVIVREKSSESNEEVEFTLTILTEMAGELRHALEKLLSLPLKRKRLY